MVVIKIGNIVKDKGIIDAGAIGLVTAELKFNGQKSFKIYWLNGQFKGRNFEQLEGNLKVLDKRIDGEKRIFLGD